MHSYIIKLIFLIILLIKLKVKMETTSQMNKTQMNMYSTFTPVGGSLKRGELSGVSRSSRYRYANTNRAFNPEIANLSSSINKQFRTQTKMALPGIKRQKGFMLQEWLNDALQGDEGPGLKQPLKTLKKYEMDKGSLKNANLTNDQIANLYNGLFVYTSGIKSTFQDMFKSASLQSRDDHKIQKTYWKMFIKLLQNTIPVKTCFQIIEDQYRRQIANLRRTIVQENQKKDLMQQDYEDRLRKLRKQIQEFERKEKQLQQQFKVMNSNLILYEDTFNEQVSLRLKFQEKINQVYTSYDQLKEKYEWMRQDLGFKSKHLMQTLQEKYRLESKVTDELIKNEDIIKKLELAENRLAERESQIIIKNQQITDIKQQNHTQQEKKKKQQIALDELIMTIKILKKNQQEHDKRINKMSQIIDASQVMIKRLKEALSTAREKNDQLYLKHHQTVIKATQLQNIKIRLNLELEQTKAKLVLTQNKLGIAITEKDEFLTKFSNAEIELDVKSKLLENKNEVIQIFDENIAELKAIKDRYERLNQMLKNQLQTTKDQLDTKIKQIGELRSKSFQHKHETQKFVKLINQHETTIQYLKKSIEKKDLEIRDINESFRGRLNEATIKVKEAEYEIKQQRKELQKANDSLSKKDNQKLNKLEEMTFCRKRNLMIEKELKEKKDKITELLQEQQAKTIEIDQLKKKLQSKEFTLNHKKDEIDGEIINLKLSLLKYKKTVQDRKQYVNPMIYEDQRSLIIELVNRIKILEAKSREQNQS